MYFQFVQFHELGHTLSNGKENRTYAVLTDIQDGHLMSELHITVSEKYANPTISCIGVSNGTDDDDNCNETRSFTVASKLCADCHEITAMKMAMHIQ